MRPAWVRRGTCTGDFYLKGSKERNKETYTGGRTILKWDLQEYVGIRNLKNFLS
jgi:hypothetical protein